MNRLSRSTALKIAAIISFLLGAWGFIDAIPYLIQGQQPDNPGANEIPYFVIVSGFVFAILRIIGAYGTWKNQRFGISLTLVTNALDALLAVPGILFAPTVALQISSAIGVSAAIVVIVLCLWRDHRPAAA